MVRVCQSEDGLFFVGNNAPSLHKAYPVTEKTYLFRVPYYGFYI